MHKKLIVFADYTCPYCLLGEPAVARLQADGLLVESAAFELRPPGTALPPVEHAVREPGLAVAAARAGRAVPEPQFVVRTRKAHEAVAYARAEGAARRMHEALYRAYWDDGRDIGRIDVLSGIAADIGLDPTAAKVALDIDQWTAFVEGQEAWAARLGIRAVPAYVLVDDDVVRSVRVGLQHYPELREWITVTNDV